MEMRAKPSFVLATAAIFALGLVCSVPAGLAQETSFSYKLLNQADGSFSYTLNIVVPQSLNDYYQGLNHRSASDVDFPKFVTPHAVKPIADTLRQIYTDDEDFTNGILTLVHQIPYDATVQEFYPAETLARNVGDCDMFSLLAASVMKAGGLHVVLLHYTDEEHMNIGVHLDNDLRDARSGIFSVEDGGVKYYVAECTSSSWKEGWRVGECPSDLQDAKMTVITLEGSEEMSPGQVSASFKKLEATSLEFDVSPSFAAEGSSITVKGQINPAVPNENVTIYLSTDGAQWTVLNSTMTQSNGLFTFVWKANTFGALSLRASWTGNDLYAGTTSNAKNTLILPFYLLLLIVLAMVLIAVSVAAFFLSRNRRKQALSESVPKNANAVENPPVQRAMY